MADFGLSYWGPFLLIVLRLCYPQFGDMTKQQLADAGWALQALHHPVAADAAAALGAVVQQFSRSSNDPLFLPR